MSPEAIKQAAQRNRLIRSAQLSVLRPLAAEARQKAQLLRSLQEDAQTTLKSIELFSTLRHVPNFFPTPRRLIAQMIEIADIQPGQSVLEPSAGKGDLAEAVRTAGGRVVCVELNATLVGLLRQKGFDVTAGDFLGVPEGTLAIDKVVANPPFDHGSAVKHIRHAFRFLKPGGRLVSVATSADGAGLESWAADNLGYILPLPEVIPIAESDPRPSAHALSSLKKPRETLPPHRGAGEPRRP